MDVIPKTYKYNWGIDANFGLIGYFACEEKSMTKQCRNY